MQSVERRERVLALLQEHPSFTQEELAAALQNQGITVTQSTLSRDLQELGFIKRGGVYQQVNPVTSPLGQAGLRSATPAGPNLIVAKTEIAAAQRVGVLLDSMGLSGLVGTIAGDDTLFLAVEDENSQKKLLDLFAEVSA